MKMSMRLTLDGLVRALRAEAHRLADEVESGQRRTAEDGEKRLDESRVAMRYSDDRARR